MDIEGLPQLVVVSAFTALVGAVLIALAKYIFGSNTEVTEKQYPVILGIATGQFPFKTPQTAARDYALNCNKLVKCRGIVPRVYEHSRIDSRYLAIPDFTTDGASHPDRFFTTPPSTNKFDVSIEDRLVQAKKAAVPMVTKIASEAMSTAGVSVEDIGKLIVVSSTTFFGPGLDCALIEKLGLNRTVDRCSIGYMGCAAAVNGIRVANDFVRMNPTQKALLVCVEVSSVNTTMADSVNEVIIHAIFADGCAAAVIGATTPSKAPRGTLAIVDAYQQLLQATEDGISLDMRKDGITCTLSKHLGSYIESTIGGYVKSFLDRHGMTQDEVSFWAVHPGGTRIIEAVEKGLGLTEKDTFDSWEVLREYGNMLSPSVLYVLQRKFKLHKEALARGEKGFESGLAFSFSPGIGVEGFMLRSIA